jgi:hypothetical protein
MTFKDPSVRWCTKNVNDQRNTWTANDIRLNIRVSAAVTPSESTFGADKLAGLAMAGSASLTPELDQASMSMGQLTTTEQRKLIN